MAPLVHFYRLSVSEVLDLPDHAIKGLHLYAERYIVRQQQRK